MLITDGRDGKRFFPMEVCIVVDNQRVTTTQQSPMLVQSVIRSCALPPDVLRAQTEETVKSLHLQDSEHLRAAEITTEKDPIVVVSLPYINLNTNEKWNIDLIECSSASGTYYRGSFVFLQFHQKTEMRLIQ